MGSELTATVFGPPRAAAPWRLSDVVGHDRVRVYSLARWALAEALKLAGAKTVLVPGFICREALAGVHAAGAAPVFYAVDRRLRPIPPLPAADAAIAVNYFGFPQDLSAFKGAVIEDNAHGFLSRDEQGRPLGTRTALGVLSQRKTVPLPDGGALLVNDASLSLPPQVDPGEAPASLSFMRRRRVARLLGPRSAMRLMKAARLVRKLRTGSEVPHSDPKGETEMPCGPRPSREAAEPTALLDPRAEVERRRALYAFCAELLRGKVEPVFDSLPANCSPYGFPFRGEAEALLERHGLFSLPWPDLPDAVAPSAPAHLKDVRLVHFLW